MWNKLKILVQDFIAFQKRKKSDGNLQLPKKTVLINVENPNLYHRFFYILLKYLQKAGYTIYYPMSFDKYRNIKHNNQYFSWIVNEEGLVRIADISSPTLSINDDDLSPDFFKDYFENDNIPSGYHFPLSFHPSMYHANIEDQNFEKEKIHSVYSFGNFEEENYSEIDNTPFDIPNRYQTLLICQTLPNYRSINNQEEIENLDLTDNNSIFIAEKNTVNIPLKKVRENLAKFQFFLACPGVVMPHCHNIIEAMSVGCIPILHTQYADQFYPVLINKKNAITYDSLQDLEEILSNGIKTISKEEIELMTKEVNIYYETYLKPSSVVQHLEKSLHYQKIYINAEHRSVNRIVTKP